MTMTVGAAHPADPAPLDLQDLLHTLADPSRLALLAHLRLGEHRVVELTEHLGLAQSTVSAHLHCLRDAGLVHVRPVGRASVYSLAAAPELAAALEALRRLDAATRAA